MKKLLIISLLLGSLNAFALGGPGGHGGQEGNQHLAPKAESRVNNSTREMSHGGNGRFDLRCKAGGNDPSNRSSGHGGAEGN